MSRRPPGFGLLPPSRLVDCTGSYAPAPPACASSSAPRADRDAGQSRWAPTCAFDSDSRLGLIASADAPRTQLFALRRFCLVASGGAVLLLVGAAAALVLHSRERRLPSLGGPRGAQQYDELHCGVGQENVDYWTPEPLYSLLYIASADACAKICESDALCFTWTWGQSAHIDGAWKAYHTCFLKKAPPDAKPLSTKLEGVVSGIACHGSQLLPFPAVRTLPGSSTDSTTFAVVTTLATTSTSPTNPPSTFLYMHPPGNSPAGLKELFCWALIMPSGYEPVLMAMLYAMRASLFACDQAAVYSNQTIQVTPGLQTKFVDVNLHCEYGGEFKTALNADIFMAVWKHVVDEGMYSQYTWTVKVDADCVFFPSRLRSVLVTHVLQTAAHGVYLNNCKFGMHGPLEVLSQKAVETWVWGQDLCRQHFNTLCNGDCFWGEDMFFDQCMQRVLGSRRDNEFSLLVEDHCAPPQGWQSCTDTSTVSFHPFKQVDTYQKCLQSALQASGTPLVATAIADGIAAANAAGGAAGFFSAAVPATTLSRHDVIATGSGSLTRKAGPAAG